MASAKNQTVGRMSPRQKMINLMYIVLTAMLALNVSSDVLNGFSQVEDGLSRSNRTITLRNAALIDQLQAFCDKNPEIPLAEYSFSTLNPILFIFILFTQKIFVNLLAKFSSKCYNGGIIENRCFIS